MVYCYTIACTLKKCAASDPRCLLYLICTLCLSQISTRFGTVKSDERAATASVFFFFFFFFCLQRPLSHLLIRFSGRPIIQCFLSIFYLSINLNFPFRSICFDFLINREDVQVWSYWLIFYPLSYLQALQPYWLYTRPFVFVVHHSESYVRIGTTMTL